MNIELSQIKVNDGGPDGDVDTAGDNSLFEVQGIFIPLTSRNESQARSWKGPEKSGPFLVPEGYCGGVAGERRTPRPSD